MVDIRKQSDFLIDLACCIFELSDESRITVKFSSPHEHTLPQYFTRSLSYARNYVFRAAAWLMNIHKIHKRAFAAFLSAPVLHLSAAWAGGSLVPRRPSAGRERLVPLACACA